MMMRDTEVGVKWPHLKKRNLYGSTSSFTPVTSNQDEAFPIESVNWYRVVAVLFYTGTAVLRDLLFERLRKVFKKDYATLKDALFDKSGAHAKLISKKGGLYGFAREALLSEENFEEDKLDISTLVQILLEVKMKKDKKELLSGEARLKDQVTKMKNKRNSLFHDTDPRLNHNAFESEWEDIKDILTILDINSKYSGDIDDWKVKPFGQEQRNDVIQHAHNIEHVNIKNLIHNHYYYNYNISPTRRSSVNSLQPNCLLAIGDENFMNIEIEGFEVYNISQEELTYYDFPDKLKFINLSSFSSVCVCLGTFDLEKESDDEEVKINVARGIIELGNAFNNTAVYVLSVLPINEINENMKALNGRVQLMNEFIKKRVKRNKTMRYINVFDAVVLHQKNISNCYLTDSGIRLNRTGKQVVTQIIHEHLRIANAEYYDHQDIEMIKVQEKKIDNKITMTEQMQPPQMVCDDESHKRLSGTQGGDHFHGFTEEGMQYGSVKPKHKTTTSKNNMFDTAWCARDEWGHFNSIYSDESGSDKTVTSGSSTDCQPALTVQGTLGTTSDKKTVSSFSLPFLIPIVESVQQMSPSMYYVPGYIEAGATSHTAQSNVTAMQGHTTPVPTQNQPHTAVPTQNQSPNAVPTQNQPHTALTTQNQPHTALTTQDQSLNAVPAQNQSPNSVTTHNQSPNSVTTQNQSHTALTTQNQPHTTVPTHNQSPNPVPTGNQSPNDVPAQNQPYTAVTTQDQSLTAVPAQNQSPNSVTTQNQPPTAVNTQNQSFNAVTTQNHSPIAVTTQNQPHTAVPTQNQFRKAVPTQNQSHDAVTTQNQLHTAVTTQTQSLNANLTQKQSSIKHDKNNSDTTHFTTTNPSTFSAVPTKHSSHSTKNTCHTTITHSSPRIVNTAPAILTKSIRDLSKVSNMYLGFGTDCVITESDRGDYISKYIVDSVDGRLLEVWCEKRPHSVNKKSRKYVLANDNIVMQYDDNGPTYIYSGDLKHELGTFRGDFGFLCGAFGNHIIYGKNDGQSCFQLQMYSIGPNSNSMSPESISQELVDTLPRSVRSNGVSVASHKTSYLAILDRTARTMDIYTPMLQHGTRILLEDRPLERNGVAALGDVIVVAARDRLSLYSWVGERLTVLKTDQLGVAGEILGIGGTSGRLLLAPGYRLNGVGTLSVYDVQTSTQNQPSTPVLTQNQHPTAVPTRNLTFRKHEKNNAGTTNDSTAYPPPLDTDSTSNCTIPTRVYTAPELNTKYKIDLSKVANTYLGFGINCVITESGEHISKYTADRSSGRVREVWSENRPRSVNKKSRKYLLADGNVAMQYGDKGPTFVYSGELKQELETFKGDFGVLCGAFRYHVIYSKKDGQNNCRLHVYRIQLTSESAARFSHELITTLPKSVRSDHVSVCRHHTGYLAVSESKASTLDIYSNNFQLVRRIKLEKQPLVRNSVAAVGDVIVVAAQYCLSVYSWAGERLAVLYRNKLGVKEWIWGIGGTGQRLLLAEGKTLFPDDNVHTLRVYEVFRRVTAYSAQRIK